MLAMRFPTTAPTNSFVAHLHDVMEPHDGNATRKHPSTWQTGAGEPVALLVLGTGPENTDLA